MAMVCSLVFVLKKLADCMRSLFPQSRRVAILAGSTLSQLIPTYEALASIVILLNPDNHPKALLASKRHEKRQL